MPARSPFTLSLALALLAPLATLSILPAATAHAAPAFPGPLDPPAGPITPTQKPLAELEPRTAINAANTPGDANSRFRITAPGSYYLTGNLTGVAGDSGIEIAASNVTIDLMGFAITGAALSADGITTDGLRNNITIRNGVITNWDSDGINLTTGGAGIGVRVEGVIASGNGGFGIRVGNRALIRSCQALSNGSDGINATSNAVLVECIASLNGARGIVVGSGSTLTSCTASNNTTDGFFLVGNAVATICTSIGNTRRGFFVGLGGVVTQCIATSNGDHGIELASRSVATNNTVHSNTNAGATAAGILSTGDSNKVLFNHCIANDVGIEVSGGTDSIVADNSCGDSTGSAQIRFSGALFETSAIFYRNFAQNATGGANPFDFGTMRFGQAPIANIYDDTWQDAPPNSDHPWANFRH